MHALALLFLPDHAMAAILGHVATGVAAACALMLAAMVLISRVIQ